MEVMRALLLKGSESRWLEHQFRRRAFARKAVSRFMPGEELDDALHEAAPLEESGIETIVTYLGENVATAAEATAVHDHYVFVDHCQLPLNCGYGSPLSPPSEAKRPLLDSLDPLRESHPQLCADAALMARAMRTYLAQSLIMASMHASAESHSYRSA